MASIDRGRWSDQPGVTLLIALLATLSVLVPTTAYASGPSRQTGTDSFTVVNVDASTAEGVRDYGDAPDSGRPGVGSYNTNANSNGPSHLIDPDLYLGSMVPDADSGLLQSVTATADDNTGSMDEGDGIVVPAITTASETVEMAVNFTNNGGVAATVACWIDFNRNGLFGDVAGEHASATVGNESQTAVTFNDFTVVGGITYIRCRIARDAGDVAVPTGPAQSGEVEDVQVAIAEVPLAVQLSFIIARQQDETVSFAWETATENGISGFYLYVEQAGERVLVTPQMVPSAVIESVEPQRYVYEASATGKRYYIEVVNISGDTQHHGPFVVGEVFGRSVFETTTRSTYLPLVLVQ